LALPSFLTKIKLEALTRDLVIGVYSAGNGIFNKFVKDTGNIEKWSGGVKIGEYVTVNNVIEPQTILFLLAHPDDEQFQAGTIQQLIANGHSVYVVYTTSGREGEDVRGIITDKTALGIAREAEATVALNSLGVATDHIVFLRLDNTYPEVTDISAILFNLVQVIATAGITVDCIVSFDDVGIYGKDEHIYAGYAASQYYLLGGCDRILRFTVPWSDADQLNGFALTVDQQSMINHAVNDSTVDSYYKLTAPQIVLKQGVIDAHVTQFIDPIKTDLKDHYEQRPYEYFITGFENIAESVRSTKDYLKILLEN
jgi:LmbE family N-acetylglucosaminyl deacetylase